MVRRRPAIPKGFFYSFAWLAAGLLLLGCVSAPQRAQSAAPSPDSATLPGPDDPVKLGAALRWSDGNLWLILSDGRWVRQLTSLAGAEGEMSWSPDGKHIVFDAADGVYVVDVEATGLRKLVPLSNWVGHGPAWSPKGDLILMSEGRLGRMRPDGTELQLLPSPVAGEHASWSPDGARITFAGTAPVQPWDIFTANADGMNVRDLTNNEFYEMAPAWSPDGTRIAYGAAPGNARHVGTLSTTEIVVMNSDGTRPIKLTHGDPATPGFPKWLPDGRVSFTTEAGELWVVAADGRNPQMLARGCGPVAWRP